MLKFFKTPRFMREASFFLKVLPMAFPELFGVVLILGVMLLFASACAVRFLLPHVIHGEDHDPEKIAEHFGSVTLAMSSLVQSVMGGIDWGNIVDVLLPIPLSAFLLTCYVIFIHIFILNIVTGLMLNRALELARRDDQDKIADQKEAQTKIRDKLLSVLRSSGLTTTDDGLVTVECLQEVLLDAQVDEFMQLYGIDITDVDMFIKMLVKLEIGEDLNIDTVVEGCLNVRGAASSLEMLALRFQLENLTDHVYRISDALHPGSKVRRSTRRWKASEDQRNMLMRVRASDSSA